MPSKIVLIASLLFAASLLSGCAAMQPVQPPQQVIDCSHSFGSPGCVAVGK